MAKPSDKDPGKKAFIALSRKAVAGWVVVVFIISAWMFGVGVMVGRGKAPIGFELDQLKRTLESMQKAAQPAPKSGPRSQPSEMKNKTDLGFYESLPKNREDAELPNIQPAPHAARPEPVAPKPSETPASAKAEKPPAPPAPPPAAAVPAPVPGKPLTVQIAAVKSEEEARQFAEKLRQNIQDLDLKFKETGRALTMTAGVSSFPLDAKDAFGLIEAADKAMYTGKARGRNVVEAANFGSDKC